MQVRVERIFMMRTRTIRLAVLVLGAGVCAAAQGGDQTQPGTTPAPAFGQNAPVLNPENPPITSLDEPGLDLHPANRSFFSPALQVSESADTNALNQLGGSDLESVSRVLGAFDLQQFWPKSDLFLEYLGGGAFYSNPYDVKQLHAAGLEAVTRWRTGQMTLHDKFSYLPDGSFSIGTFGGLPGFGLAAGGLGTGDASGGLPGAHLFGSGELGSVGNIPRLANTAILDVVQAINPRSAITVAGGFSNAHFYDPTNTLIDSDQFTIQGGYSRLISRHDQIGAIYAFQVFQFPEATGGQFINHVVNVRWSHTISGRLSLLAGAGPQYTILEEGGTLPHWSVSARVQLRYKVGHSSMVLSYQKFTSAGSGFFAGADTQSARFAFNRPLGRTWEVFGDFTFTNEKKIQPIGVAADSYNNGTAGAILRKHLGRSYDVFVAYRYGETSFDVPICASGSCGKTDQRQTGTMGLEWHPRPTRIE